MQSEEMQKIRENNGKILSFLRKMTITNGFFQEMLTFFRKMMTSNEVCDSILNVDEIQTSSNIYDDDDDDQS